MKHIINNTVKLLVLAAVLGFTACEDVFSPAIENTRGIDAMYHEPTYAQGILANAYVLLPYSASPNSDVATDDAVSNDISNNYRLMAGGTWSSSNNPMSQWQARRNAIQYINLFLENADEVEWSKDETVRMLYNNRLKGEAYGLRAVQMYYLLLAHGGWTSDGRLMGIPNLTLPETASSDFNVPRNTFQECIRQIFDDVDRAVELLPLDYEEITDDALIPAKFKALGVTKSGDYSRVNGDRMKGRMSGRIAEAVRACRSSAASPAYSEGTEFRGLMQQAMQLPCLMHWRCCGVDPNGGTWYTNTAEIAALAGPILPKSFGGAISRMTLMVRALSWKETTSHRRCTEADV